MEDIKLACISCHIVIFSFGVFLLIIFGIFTVCDFDEFQYKEIASNHSKGITALIYWIPAMVNILYYLLISVAFGRNSRIDYMEKEAD